MLTQPGQAAIWPLTPVSQRQATCRGPEQSQHVSGGVPELQTARRRSRAITASRRHRRPEVADGTPEARSDRDVSAAPASRSGRRHAGGPKRPRRVSGIGRSQHPVSLARHLRLCGNGRSFLAFPEENDEMTWHFSPTPSRGPILIWETAGRLIALKRSTLRSSFLPRHFGSAN